MFALFIPLKDYFEVLKATNMKFIRQTGINVSSDLKECRTYMKKNHPDLLYQAKQKNGLLALLQTLDAWTFIMVSVWATHIWMWLAPFSIVIMGFKQRLLNNIIHSASHHHNFNNRFYNDWHAQIFAALPLFDSIQAYRIQHLTHHAFLGEIRDPDLIDCEVGGFKTNFMTALWTIIFNRVRWKANFIGRVIGPSTQIKFSILTWWLLFALLLWVSVGSGFLTSFILLWFISKATIYHTINSFTELSDHGGLEPESTYSFSRTMPNNVLSRFTHPYGDTYHLAHHLFPDVNVNSLKFLHQKLLYFPKYEQSHHFKSFFFPPDALAASRIYRPKLTPTVDQ